MKISYWHPSNLLNVCMRTILIDTFIDDTNLGYMCYECDSTVESNCFDLPSDHRGVACDAKGTGEETCYAIHLSGNLKTIRRY